MTTATDHNISLILKNIIAAGETMRRQQQRFFAAPYGDADKKNIQAEAMRAEKRFDEMLSGARAFLATLPA